MEASLSELSKADLTALSKWDLPASINSNDELVSKLFKWLRPRPKSKRSQT
jgi:hypothetical protein